VNGIALALFGPLVGPECRRAVARGWLVLVRTIAAVLLALVLLGFWFWWSLSLENDPTYQPPVLLRFGIVVLEIMSLIIAVVMAPAVMAGSLAGEKERGALGLLLTTRVNAFEIVLGRTFGKLSQLAMMVLAPAPLIALLAATARFPLSAQLMLVTLPLVIAFGGLGISAAASSVSKRGRDALIAVYLALVVVLFGPRLLPVTVAQFLAPLNPFAGAWPLADRESSYPALAVSAVWFTLGWIGIGIAAWRLRPTCLAQAGGEARGKRVRRIAIPPIGDRPMMWKELFIDRVGTIGRVGRWLGLLISLTLVGAGFAVLILTALGADTSRDPGLSGWLGWLGGAISTTGIPLVCLLQWAVGLRAAVTIASERERGTWDGLLTSPLEGGEIVRGKLWGSLFALRWLFLATVWVWFIGLICGVLRWHEVVVWISHVLIVGAFMAAVGVRSSLASATATRSMSVTIGAWLAVYALASVVSVVVAAVLAILGLLLGLLAQQLGFVFGRAPAIGWFFLMFQLGYQLSLLGIFLGITLSVVSEARLRFDRVAGRMAGGEVEVAVDQLLYSKSLEPVSEAELFKWSTGRDAPISAPSGDDEPEGVAAGPAVG
jgi:ABC-type transport system involved in multi-copper enzyme maturation permease subunit